MDLSTLLYIWFALGFFSFIRDFVLHFIAQLMMDEVIPGKSLIVYIASLSK